MLKMRMESGRPKLHALVCDDERHIVRLIQVNLERQGYRISVAFDGIQALASMRADKPDLVILDTEMPFMSGYEVLDAMREDEGLRDIPVLMLDGERDGDAQPPRTPPGGPTPVVYLRKPLNIVALLAATRPN